MARDDVNSEKLSQACSPQCSPNTSKSSLLDRISAGVERNRSSHADRPSVHMKGS